MIHLTPPHRALTLTALLGLAGIAAAQQPNANDLLSDEWRVRNRAAKLLVADTNTSNRDLLRVLETPWNGRTPSPGVGAVGRMQPSDPRDQTLASADKEIGYDWKIRGGRYPSNENELVGPWHPHKLAAFVLIQRGKPDELQDLKPSDTDRARIWFACVQPSQEQIEAALADPETAEAVLWALLPKIEDRKARLLRMIALGPTASRRAALRMIGDTELGAAQIEGAIQQLLEDDEDAYRRNAAHHLVRSGRAAAEALAKHFKVGRRERHRVLAVLCFLKEHAQPAVNELLASLAEDVTSQRRALVCLSNIDIPEAVQAQAATAICERLQTSRSRIVKVLAADALARCGKGVTEQQLAGLHEMLQQRRHRVVHARLLASLGRLDAVPELPLDRLALLAKGTYANVRSHFVLADRGEEAVALLRKYRLLGPGVATRLAERNPELVLGWITDDDVKIRKAAMQGLLEAHPARLTSPRLVELMKKDPELANLAYEALSQRKDRDEYRADLLAFLADRQWLNRGDIEMVRTLQPSLPALIEMFEPQLKKGQLFDVVLGLDDDHLRKRLNQWVEDEPDDNVRDDLLRHLVRLGLKSGREIQFVERALQSDHSIYVLSALSRADQVPAQLIPTLEKICDQEPDNDWWSGDWDAREALITAHR